MNERFTRTIRKTQDKRNETKARYTKRTHDTRTNEMKRANYMENANERTHDTRSERTIHETNERYTNERIIGGNHILSNDKRSWFYRSTI
jgi:hypothetical protein